MSVDASSATPREDAQAVRLSVRNAAAFWAAVARTRKHELIQRPGLLAVVGDERAGVRILVLQRSLDPDTASFLDELVTTRPGLPVTIEDQFAATDFGHLGLTSKRLPVMQHSGSEAVPGGAEEEPIGTEDAPSGAPAAVSIRAVESVDDLRRAESVVVHGFDLPRLQPYRAGEAFPDDLLWYPGIRLFLARREDRSVGACLCVAEGTCGGIYWVTTQPEHRSTGVGRAVMVTALAQLAGSAVSLTATAAGEPLYRDLGFRKVAQAAWWSRADSTADPDPG
jgi:GNAT superfamily N-acetyltransferase